MRLNHYLGFSAKLPVLSRRELVLIGSAAGVLFLIILLQLLPALSDAWSRQREELTALKGHQETLPYMLEQYQRLIQRKSDIERQVASVELGEGEALGIVDRLLGSRKPEFIQDYSIDTPPARAFGVEHLNETVLVRGMRINNYGELVKLLSEIVAGEKPLLLERIRLQVSRRDDFLTVDLHINAIAKREQQ